MSINNLYNRILNHQGFKRYFYNTGWMVSENIIRMIAALFIGVWVARYLGPEKYGILNYAIAFTAIFSVFAKLGLDGIVVRELVNEPEKENIILGTSFWMKIFSGILVIMIIFLININVHENQETNLYIGIISIGILFQSSEIIKFYFQSKVLSKFVSICQLIQLLISSVLKIYFILSNFNLIWFVMLLMLDQVTLSLSLFIAYGIKRIKNILYSFNIDLAKKLLLDSWPLILSGFVVMVYMRSDQIMIKALLNDREVGVYSAAVKLSEIWYFIPLLITNSIFPAILNARKKSQDLYLHRMKMLYSLLIWLAIFVAVPMTFLSNKLIYILFGNEYQAAGEVLKIHIWTGIFVFMGVAFSKYLLSENFTKKSLYRTSLGAVSNIFLNLILIPKYGIKGAAIGTLSAQIISNYIYDFFDSDVRYQLKLKTTALFDPFGIFSRKHFSKT